MDQVKAERFSCGRFDWSDRPDDAVSQADRERVVAGALIQEGLALLHDESLDLDLIGFDATELERLLALAVEETAQTQAGENPGRDWKAAPSSVFIRRLPEAARDRKRPT